MNKPVIQWIRKFLQGTFPVSLVISLSVFIWLRLIFYEVPFSLSEDTITLVKVILSGWLMVLAIKGSFYLLLGMGWLLQKRR